MESMTSIHPELVERYQIMLEKDPKSLVFAPLAEAYRQMGMLEEGLEVCRRGLKHHPDFPGGRIALARLLLAKGEIEAAVPELTRAVTSAPENLLAHSLLGETYLKLRQAKNALAAYKMILLLNPSDTRAQATVRKLESLTADEYDEELFAMKRLTHAAEDVHGLELERISPIEKNQAADPEAQQARDLERILSLADAFLVRNDFERAETTLLEGEKVIGSHPDIDKRLRLLRQRQEIQEGQETFDHPHTASRAAQGRKAQLEALKSLRERVRARRRNE